MFSSKLKIYLKTIISTPSVDFKWTSEHNEKFFSYINENFTSISLNDKDVQLSIKQIFKEYFEPVGYILFKMSETQLRIKVFPYKIEPKDSINLDSIIDIIDENENYIEYDYNGKEDLICLKKELTLKIAHFVNRINNEEINKKELLKYGVREAFELYESDIVIIKNNQIFIKLFDDASVREVPEDEKNTIANRYNGVDENELSSFYNDFFLKDISSDFFNTVAEQFVDIYLLDKKIDNATYEKYAFSVIQSIISEKLKDSFDENEEFFKGFSGYVFRIHFKEVFGYIADLILSEMVSSNDYIIEFLKYYSLNIVVLDGEKYKVPEIEAENGLKWNVISMMSIVKIYIKTKMSISETRDKKHALEDVILGFYVGNLSPLEYNNNINKDIEKIVQNISYMTKRLNVYVSSLNSPKNSGDMDRLKNDIKKIKYDIHLQKNQKAKLESKLVDRFELAQYNSLKREIDSLSRQEKRDGDILKQNRDSYTSIRDSLVKALTSKKMLLEDTN